MSKYLITGFSGFVSRYFVESLASQNEAHEVIGVSRTETISPDFENLKISSRILNLDDFQKTIDLMREVQPDFIIHLASDSSVAHSWIEPVDSFRNNTNIFLNLVESVRLTKIKCRILSIGSSEEYGIVDPGDLPLKESHYLNPISPYAVARVSQELLSNIYVKGYGMDIVLTRSFNHIGPAQRPGFVISSFAKQIVRAKNGKGDRLEVGNLDIIRDFLDVRDVVRAYLILLETGIKGEVYNVCSGKGTSLKLILDEMMKLCGVDIEYFVNPSLIRPSDNPAIIGSNEKIKRECGWTPEIPLEKSLRDILEYWTVKNLRD